MDASTSTQKIVSMIILEVNNGSDLKTAVDKVLGSGTFDRLTANTTILINFYINVLFSIDIYKCLIYYLFIS